MPPGHHGPTRSAPLLWGRVGARGPSRARRRPRPTGGNTTRPQRPDRTAGPTTERRGDRTGSPLPRRGPRGTGPRPTAPSPAATRRPLPRGRGRRGNPDHHPTTTARQDCRAYDEGGGQAGLPVPLAACSRHLRVGRRGQEERAAGTADGARPFDKLRASRIVGPTRERRGDHMGSPLQRRGGRGTETAPYRRTTAQTLRFAPFDCAQGRQGDTRSNGRAGWKPAPREGMTGLATCPTYRPAALVLVRLAEAVADRVEHVEGGDRAAADAVEAPVIVALARELR